MDGGQLVTLRKVFRENYKPTGRREQIGHFMRSHEYIGNVDVKSKWHFHGNGK